MIIGLIGKVGSGKSACMEYLKEHYDVIGFSCDDIAKDLIDKGMVDYKIGNSYDFFTNEKLQDECRQKVHPKVFLRIVENIYNSENISEQISINIISSNKYNFKEHTGISTKRHYVIETALPSEILYNICDKVINVYNTYEKKVELLKKNRNYIDNQVKLIYDSQEYYEKFYDKADYKIENNGTKEELLNKIKEVMDEICIDSK